MKKIIILLLISISAFAQNPVRSEPGFLAGTTMNNMPASAISEFRSTAKGVLFPRMTTTQRNAIASPANSLLIFNTTTGRYEFYNGTAWVAVSESQDLDATLGFGNISTNEIYLQTIDESSFTNMSATRFYINYTAPDLSFVSENWLDNLGLHISDQTTNGIAGIVKIFAKPQSVSSANFDVPDLEGTNRIIPISATVNGGSKVYADAQGNIELDVEGSGGVESVSGNSDVVNNTDPANPVITAVASVGVTGAGSNTGTTVNPIVNILPSNLSFTQSGLGLSLASSTQTIVMSPLPTATSTPNVRDGVMPGADKVSLDQAKAVIGLLKANGSGGFSAAVAGTDYASPFTLTTTGTTANASYSGNVLNIPNYGTYADTKVENNLTASNTVAPSKTAVNTALATKTDKVSTTTDNTIVRFDGTAGAQQTSTIAITDNGELLLPATASPGYTQGKLAYDSANESLTFYNNDSNIGLQIGQEEWIRVRNVSGSTIANGAAVYINGSNSGLPTIALAQGNSLSTSVCAGLATEAIPNNSIGYVTSLGLVNGLNTSGFTSGAIYLSETTPGGLTQTVPTSPNYRYRIGIVSNVNASTGSIHVTPSTASVGNGLQGQFLTINASGSQAWRYSKSGMFPSADFSYAVTANNLTKAFNVGNTGAGAFNAQVRAYYFDGFISLSGLSATNGSVSFGFLGTATISGIRYTPLATKAAVPSAALSGNVIVSTPSAVTTSTTNTTAIIRVTGMVRVSGAGTLIPAVAASVSTGSVITGANSWFTFEEMGANTGTATPDVD